MSANWPGYGTIASGGAPVPNAWIRLTRTNDLFTAWRGTNGVDWTPLRNMTMSFTGRVYVGLAACPVNNGAGQAITAWFRDYQHHPRLPAACAAGLAGQDEPAIRRRRLSLSTTSTRSHRRARRSSRNQPIQRTPPRSP